MEQNTKEKNMHNDSLFFLFTCVKEGRDYIGKLFDSLLSQTKINFIHYIYDDGSDDPVDDLVEEYKERAKHIDNPYTIIYEKGSKNIGLNMATKHCIKKCTCPYFIWIDCDNWVNDSFFEELEKIARKNKDAIVIRTELYDSDTNSLANYPKRTIKKRMKHNQTKQFFYDFFYFSFFAVKNDAFRNINKNCSFLDKRSFFNDRQVILSCVLSGGDFAFSKKSIGYFLKKNNNESTLYETHDLMFRFNCYKELALLFDYTKSYQIPIIYKLRLLLNEIEENKTSHNYHAWKLLFLRIRLLRTNHVDPMLLYKYGNTFIWMFILSLSWLKYVIKKYIIRKGL